VITSSKESNRLSNSSSKYNSQNVSLFEEEFFNSNKTYIHPTSIIGPNVELGQNVKIGPYCTIIGNVKIHSNTCIYANVTIGFPAQNLETNKSLGIIEIGENCKIREFVTIGASISENGETKIGNNCYIMSYSHIAHDVTLEDNVVLINSVNLGGHVYVEKNAFLMASSAAHQFCRIGQFSALTPFSGIRQDLPPFCMFEGRPAKYFGLNSVALKRANFSQESINAIKHIAKLFYQDKLLLSDIEKIIEEKSEESWTQDKNVQTFLAFVKNSKRGISRKTEF